MNATFTARRRRSAGFTLIELLLVVVILLVLAGVVLTRFSGRTEQARIAAARTGIDAIKLALKTFENDNGRFPTTEEGLQALIDRPSNAKAAASSWPYLDSSKLPVDPWGKPYIYRCPPTASKTDYDILSGGPDGNEGGGDDITNWDQ